MNQIKFRALNEETKVFVYGDLIKSQMFGSEGEKPSSSFINETPLDVEDISTSLSGGKYSFKTTFVKVIDETVGQFTGLQDKNGVDIYVGDLIKNETGRICEVVFNKYCATFDSIVKVDGGRSAESYGFKNSLWKRHVTIIGTIHQNPELIK